MGIRAIIGLIISVIVLAVYSLNPDIFAEPLRVLRSGEVAQTAAYIRSFGVWAVVVSIILSIIMTFGLIIPFILISAANGLVFGLGWGTVVSWAGEVSGAIVAFSIYRYYFRPFIIQRYAHTEYWHYVENISGRHGFKTILIARILPVIPSGILTMAASISTISFRDFAWATLLGKIPSVFAKVLVGYELVYFRINEIRLLIGLLLLILLYAGAWWMKRRERTNRS